MFDKNLKTIEDIQNKIREIWNHYKENVSEYGMDKRVAMDQAYGAGQGIIYILNEDAYNKVFSDEFRKEWENWRQEMLAL